MRTTEIVLKETPLCSLFGVCGGCCYQDIPYEEELALKGKELRALLMQALGLDEKIFEAVVPSPEPYFYRNRLDLTFRKQRGGEWKMGFMLENTHRLEEVTACPISRREINEFLPRLREEAIRTAPPDYRNANLVVRVGEEGKVFWGGMGRHSLRMKPEDYFFVTVRGRKIFYSLDTFFQANLSILERVVSALDEGISWTRDTVFLDLYSGVGLFGIALADKAPEVVMIEESGTSARIAEYNIRHHQLAHVKLVPGKVEDKLPEVLSERQGRPCVALIDPPRSGLAGPAADILCKSGGLKVLWYLSCSPESLARDLGLLVAGGWQARKVFPFDFFPRTKHLETLVCLMRSC